MPQYPGELQIAGQILEGSFAAALLRDDDYIFLTTDAGKTVLSSKYLLHARGDRYDGLATHKSLLYHLEQSLGPSQKIKASGEFRILNGAVAWISNRSGNFRGAEEHLKFGITKLAGHGLKFKTNTQVRILDANSKDDFGHTPESQRYDQYQWELRQQVFSDPELRREAFLYTELYKRIYKQWPGPVAGFADLNLFSSYLFSISLLTPLENKLGAFLFPFNDINTVDGLFHGIVFGQASIETSLIFTVNEFTQAFISHQSTPEEFRKSLEALTQD